MEYHSHEDDGKARPGTLGVAKAAKILAGLKGQAPEIPASAGVIIPENYYWPNTGRYQDFQHPLSRLLGALDQAGIRAHLLYSGDILPAGYIGTTLPAKGVALDRYKLLFGVTDKGKDNDFYDSQALQDWVHQGGVLFLESRDAQFPAWVGVWAEEKKPEPIPEPPPGQPAPVPEKATYSAAASDAHWKIAKAPGEGDVVYALTGMNPDAKPLASWDDVGWSAVMASPIDKGWVICAGTTIYDSMDKPEQLGLIWEALTLAGMEPAVEPPGPACLRMGNLVYLRASGDWNGMVRFPPGLKLAHVSQYGPDGEPAGEVTLGAADVGAMGSLSKGQFAILEMGGEAPTPPTKQAAPKKGNRRR